jgi:hypothetical protein
VTEVLDLGQEEREAWEIAKGRFEVMQAEREAALAAPQFLLSHCTATDSRTGEIFSFDFSEDSGWLWQGDVLDDFRLHQITLVLKARQLGASWVAIGYALWKVLTTPGTSALAVSINETEASVLINRAWDLFESLPDHLRFEVEVLRPQKGRPSTRIELRHPNGQISSLIAMPSTPKAGHGQVATLVILDEHARHAYAEEGWKAFIPVIADGGQIVIVSTANGIGGVFYELWMEADDRGVHTIFLPWNYHPGRDSAWYARVAKALPEFDRAEQYPLNPADAFMGTAGCWFDTEALSWYAENVRQPQFRFQFQASADGAKASVVRRSDGWVRLYDHPVEGREYAIPADVATGRGRDFSCAYVVDLTDGNIAAEFHGRVDPDLFAEQLHFLGRMFNTARIAPEMGGGYGEPVVLSLRDGRKGRPTYPRLYRHRIEDRPDFKQHITYGFPITTKTRPQIINQAEQWIRERLLPHMPTELILECKTFVRRDVLPSPRAADGANDDRVMTLCLGLEMYRLFGHHEHDIRKRRTGRQRRRATYEWR